MAHHTNIKKHTPSIVAVLVILTLTVGSLADISLIGQSDLEVRCWKHNETGETKWSYHKEEKAQIVPRVECTGAPIPTKKGEWTMHAAASQAAVSSVSNEPTVKELRIQKEKEGGKVVIKNKSDGGKGYKDKQGKKVTKVKKSKKVEKKAKQMKSNKKEKNTDIGIE